MIFSRRFAVEMPEKGVYMRKADKHGYVHYVTRTYRNEKGQPTNDSIIIGKFDRATGLLIPNENYYAHYATESPEIPAESVLFSAESSDTDVDVVVEEFEVINPGIDFAVTQILEELGVSEKLSVAFGGETAQKIEAAAKHMIGSGNVFEYCEDWCKNHLFSDKFLTSQSASRLFERISEAECFSFFKLWVKTFDSEDYIAYDVTSFSTYSTGIMDAERGYNRDGEKLPQINLGSYFAEKSGLPMFYTTYQGSITDKSMLPSMMAYNADLGIENVKFVMDKGFCSQANLKYMDGRYSFITSVYNNNKSVKSAISEVSGRVNSMKNRVSENVYAECLNGEYYGISANLHIFFNPIVREEQRNILERKIQIAEEKLQGLSQITKAEIREYGKYFTIDLHENDGFSFVRDYEKIEEIAEYNGFFCLLTDLKLTSKEVLDIYRRKEVIENSFDDIKNSIDMKRLRTCSDDTTKGKIFCAFIALIVLSEIDNRLRKYNAENKTRLTKSFVLHQLDKIRLLTVSSSKRLLCPLAKSTRTALDSLSISHDSLLSFLSS